MLVAPTLIASRIFIPRVSTRSVCCSQFLLKHRAFLASIASSSFRRPNSTMAHTSSPADGINGHSATNAPRHTHEIHPRSEEIESTKRIPNRLILCFDGTGNSFRGNTSDTNIVKLYNAFDRDHPHQMHYYQPGIGTYPADGSVNVSWWGKVKRSIRQMIDEGFATTFDSHVMAGYRFLMRYYGPGDRIYIFGFSRGAFTARFLARMINSIGLLSMGNEEMVPFAYKVYQDYETGVDEGSYMRLFKSSFCRNEPMPGHTHDAKGSGIKVHFLGLFDTVNSVGTLDVPWGRRLKVPQIIGTAEHVRHAVALDERRVKFKVALLAQDSVEKTENEDIKEVWFSGNHGDIGGGWPAESTKELNKRSSWRKFVDLFHTKVDRKETEDKDSDYFQLSDIALKWMIDELDALPNDTVRWNSDVKCSFLERFNLHREKAIGSRLHDTLRFGGGLSVGKVIFWNLLEYLPFVKRWELYKSGWKYVSFPLNMGSTRDIPSNSRFHHSVIERLRQFPNYKPPNDIWIGDQKKHVKDIDVQKHEQGQELSAGEPYFVYQEDVTVGSVKETDNCEYPVGPQKTDRISTVALQPGGGGPKQQV